MTDEEEIAYLVAVSDAELAVAAIRKSVQERSDRMGRMRGIFLLNEALDKMASIEKRYDKKPS